MLHENIKKKECVTCGCGLCCTKIQDLSVTRNHIEILKDVDLHIHCGDLTAIIGLNGAGKSTLLKAILGEIPHTGELTFLDADNRHTRRPVIGYVPQKLDFDYGSPVSVQDVFAAVHTNKPVWFSHSKKIRERAYESLTSVQAAHLINRRLGALSGGELQRVMLALALDPKPDLLLLDEPVSGIDNNGLKLFYKTVSDLRENYDLSIILVSHDFNLVAQYADRVIFLNDKIVACSGTPEEVFSDQKVIDAFGMKIIKPPGNSGGADN
ncbi:MAG: ATPase component of Mn/Zn ABC-type transporter [Desulfotomaculum sp. 46_296]|nr:MAG: ATPase component of Mn/Zn ABC-type transporter [Desulfotomaculum sp. 46_296]HAU31747.1 ABC transporter ATP-binding protein [Desulfotomaculum sp.]